MDGSRIIYVNNQTPQQSVYQEQPNMYQHGIPQQEYYSPQTIQMTSPTEHQEQAYPRSQPVPTVYAVQAVVVDPRPTDFQVGAAVLGFRSTMSRCRSCGCQGPTEVVHKPGTFAWTTAFCCLFLSIPCCCLPLLMTEFQDSYHYCRSCGQLMGKRSRL
eukprot:GILJ01014653.1.p1 GENE.GILJ01014653.1~~GILJ01014653.1.p1  ORF type:complete len:158 (+),score=1.40 GILJ01014653.1:36-509(+)